MGSLWQKLIPYISLAGEFPHPSRPQPMQRIARLGIATSLLVTPLLAAAQSNSAPITGQSVLQQMHDRYDGRWYKTLTFIQKTSRRRPDGTDAVTTWFESVRSTDAGTQLRIDVGNPNEGRGMMYTADSVWRVTNGTAAAPRADGNPFLPLIQSVYVQPVSRTAAELGRLGFDLSKAYASTRDGQPVWVVGASSASDTATSRFTVDTARRVLVHMTLVDAGQAPTDVTLGGYERAGNGWLATKIVMWSRGVAVQTEEYNDWKIDPALPAALFDLAQWSTAPHWAKKP